MREPEWDQQTRDFATVLDLIEASTCSECGQDLSESMAPAADPNYLTLVQQAYHKGGAASIKEMAQPIIYKPHHHVCYACQIQAKERDKLKDAPDGTKIWVEREED